MNINMRKDFQKAIKMYRDTLPDVVRISRFGESRHRPEYPKAMMTAQQQCKRTATVNCGVGDRAKEKAETLQSFAPFVAWCESYGIKSIVIETVAASCSSLPQYQIRVTY